jgi:hypothetical protein
VHCALSFSCFSCALRTLFFLSPGTGILIQTVGISWLAHPVLDGLTV